MGLLEQKRRMISQLKLEGFLKTPRIIKAFKSVPREEFVLPSEKNFSYSDTPQGIGHGQTISAPHMVAIMTELLEPDAKDNVLEVGAGSGYQAAILAKLVKKVYTIELIPELAEFAKANIQRAGCRNVEVVQGDGCRGMQKHAPYDKIIISCACEEIPQHLVKQLKTGGIIEAPVGESYRQELIVGAKTKDGLDTRNYGGCIFVPMRH